VNFRKSLLVSILLHLFFFCLLYFYNEAGFFISKDHNVRLYLAFDRGFAASMEHSGYSGKGRGDFDGHRGNSNSKGKGDEADSSGLAGVVGALVNAAYKNSPPQYPAIARMMGYEGRVSLLIEVLPDGRCGRVEVFRSSGYGILDRAAVNAARRWIFFAENQISLSSSVKVLQDVVFVLKLQ
jgi:TonB family protein